MSAPDDATTRDILTRARTIAVVGLSDKPERDSHEVGRYLQAQGYRIVPVNPMVTEILGERSYPSVSAIPSDVPIDIVDVFRKSDQVPPIVDEALSRNVPTIWLQLGVENPAAGARARRAGAHFYENSCIRVAHRRLKIPVKSGRP